MHSFGLSPRNPAGAHTRPLHDVQFDIDRLEGKLVIVIDDSAMICRIVEISLSKYAINTIAFHSGVDALNALHDGVVPVPDLVLLDINLPVIDGYGVAGMLTKNRTFRRDGRAVPIVMLSGKDGLFDRFRARRAGAEDFVSKPFTTPDLVRKIFPLLGLELPDDLSESAN